MKHCDECSEEAVLSNSKLNFCPDHLHLYDTPIITRMLGTDNPRLREIFFIQSFKTVNPTFGLFQLLYAEFPQVKRGKWLGIQNGFEKSQEQYLNECFEEFLKSKLKEE